MRHARALAALVLAVVIAPSVVACTHSAHSRTSSSAPPEGTRSASPPAFTSAYRCPDQPGFTCATLTVPIDHAQPAGRSLALAIAVQDKPTASHTLLVLTGGPGQPGVSFARRVADALVADLADYRVAVIDQRGTGGHALNCPQLQQQVGSTDLALPTRAAVQDCAMRIGPDRRLYSTEQTVADLDDFRAALGVQQVALDGTSYGSYVAERYAIAYPTHVSKLVLDSVVPDTGADPLSAVPMHATARVLRAVCASRACPSDPAADLAAVIARSSDGTDILNALTIHGIVHPDYAGVPEALHDAAHGDTTRLDQLVDGVRHGATATAQELSQGLHASTLCADLAWPWHTADASPAARTAALHAAVDRTPTADLYPFDRRTAFANGIAQTCLYWPDAPVPHPAGRMPDVPTLLLGGDRDLSTPIEWLHAEASRVPHPTVLIVPGASHGEQLSRQATAGRDRVRAEVHTFLG